MRPIDRRKPLSRRLTCIALHAGLLLSLPMRSIAAETAEIEALASADLTSLSLEDLMNVEVTSVSKQKQRVGDAPAAITVIHQEEIRQSGLHQIPEILRLAPGLFVQRGTQFTHWTIASRGLSYDFNNNLLVLQDGRSLYTPIFGGIVWNTVDYPIADLDRIEVIRGPGATLWGANAVNGVINITSKPADETQGVLVQSRAGTDDSDLAVRYGGQIDDDTHYRVYAKGRQFAELGSVEDVGDPNYELKSTQGGFRVDRRPSEQDLLTLQGDIFNVGGENSLRQALFVPPFSTLSPDDHEFNGGNVLTRWTHTVSDSSEYSLQTYFDHLKVDSPFEQAHISTYDVDFQHSFAPVRGHDLIYGLGARFQPFRSKPQNDGLSPDNPFRISFDPVDDDLYLFSAFVQDTVTLVEDRLKLTLGSKFEYNNFTHFELAPSARLLWTPDDRNSVWTAVSSATRTPGLDNRSFSFTPAVFPNDQGSLTRIMFTGNPDADAERLMAYELGYRSRITRNWTVDIAAFLNEHRDLLVGQQQTPAFVPTPLPHVQVVNMDVNGADVENYGMELASSLQVTGNWQVRGSYSLLMSQVINAEPGVTFAGTFYEAPRHQFQVHSVLEIARGLQFNTSLYYVDGSHDDDAIPSYTRLDVNLLWTPDPGLELQVGVQNVLDPQHPEFLPRSGPQSEIETAVYGQLTWRY